MNLDANRMAYLYKLGNSAKEVASILGYKHSNSVRQVLKKMGILRSMSEAATLACVKGKKDVSLFALIKSAKTDNRFNPKKAPWRGNPKLHPRWKKDRSKVKQKRLIFEEKEFFKQLIKERNYKCELTGLGGRLSVHHINGVWSHPHLVFSKDNCKVVLLHIHKKFHKIYGYRTTQDDWLEFILNKEYEDEYLTRVKRRFVPYEDKTGKIYGQLTVLCRSGKKWKCQCSCGKEKDVASGELNKGKTKSCGCLMPKISRENARRTQFWKFSPSNKKTA